MTNYGAEYCIRVCDLGIEDDAMLIYHSMKFGRNIFENIRRFVQFQLCTTINLLMYMIIGTMRFKDYPIQPVIVLLVNYIMVFGAYTITKELPSNNQQILTLAHPFTKDDESMFTPKMIFNIATTTFYQQTILFCMFYNGAVWFTPCGEPWIK